MTPLALRARNFTTTVIVAGLALTSLVSCTRPAQKPDGTSGPLAVGQPAPDVVGRDVEGREVRLSAQPGPVVVYFYPKDGTPGCTKEACAFRDVWGKYQQAHIAVIGVSTNSAEQHAKFLREEKLPFALAADEAGTIASAYGVGKGAFGYERVTFLVGDDHKIAQFWPNVDPGVHAAEVLTAAHASK